MHVASLIYLQLFLFTAKSMLYACFVTFGVVSESYFFNPNDTVGNVVVHITVTSTIGLPVQYLYGRK